MAHFYALGHIFGGHILGGHHVAAKGLFAKSASVASQASPSLFQQPPPQAYRGVPPQQPVSGGLQHPPAHHRALHPRQLQSQRQPPCGVRHQHPPAQLQQQQRSRHGMLHHQPLVHHKDLQQQQRPLNTAVFDPRHPLTQRAGLHPQPQNGVLRHHPPPVHHGGLHQQPRHGALHHQAHHSGHQHQPYLHHHHHHNYGLHHHHNYGLHHHRGRSIFCCCGAGCIVAILIIVILSVVLCLHFSWTSEETNAASEYSLTDKVILTYNSYFCQGLTANSTTKPDNYQQSNATLYLLRDRPPLTRVESFNISDMVQFRSEGDAYSWNFYLNEGSNVTLSICYQDNLTDYFGIGFFLIRGSGNFSKWKGEFYVYDPDTYVLKHLLLSHCTYVSYSVLKGGEFYLVLYAFYDAVGMLYVDFLLHRTVYHISPANIIQNCSILLDGRDQCSVDVPTSPGYTALLSLNTSLPVDYNSKAEVYISCQPRIWLYAVIVLCIVIIISMIMSVIVWRCIKAIRKSLIYSQLVLGREESGNVKIPGSSADTGDKLLQISADTPDSEGNRLLQINQTNSPDMSRGNIQINNIPNLWDQKKAKQTVPDNTPDSDDSEKAKLLKPDLEPS